MSSFALLKKGASEASIPPSHRETLADLVKRGLVERKESKTVSITITPDGVEALKSAEDTGFEKLTPEILSSIRATGLDVKLRPIDVSASAPVFHPGRRHPVRELIAEVREVYLSMGFAEIVGAGGPARLLELRRALHAAGPPRTRPAGHILREGHEGPAHLQDGRGGERRRGARDGMADREQGLALQVGRRGGAPPGAKDAQHRGHNPGRPGTRGAPRRGSSAWRGSTGTRASTTSTSPNSTRWRGSSSAKA